MSKALLQLAARERENVSVIMSINPRYILLVDKLSNEASIKMRLSFAMSWKKCKREKRGKRQRHSDQNQVFLMKNMQKMMR